MKLLDRYLLKEFTKNLLLILTTLLSIYLLVEFFETIDNFLEAQQPMAVAVRYFVLKIPFIVEQLMPISILLAGIITLGLANHNLELIALKAAGINTGRIVRPIILGGCLLTGLTLAMCQWLLPVTVAASNKIWYEEVEKNTTKGLILRNGRIYYRGMQGIYSFDEQHVMTTDTYSNFSYATWDDAYKLDMLLFARNARWQEGQWFFSEGQLKKRTTANNYTVTPFKQTVMQLPENPGHLFTPEHKFSERSIAELFDRAIAADVVHKNVTWMEFHKKVSYNVLGLPLLLLGLPMLLLMHQRWGRDLSLAIPSSCFLAFIAWMGWGTFQTMAKAGYLHPVPASWTIHLVVGALGLFLLRRQDR